MRQRGLRGFTWAPLLEMFSSLSASVYRHRTDERNSREKHRLWISRAYRETETLNPEKTDGQPKEIKQKPPENQRNTETLENPKGGSLSGGCV